MAIDALTLWDYRRRVADMYARVRSGGGEAAWATWRRERDALFATHPQSALDATARETFTALAYYGYDSAYRVAGRVVPVPPARATLGNSDLGQTPFQRVATVHFRLGTHDASLPVLWLDTYGGGIFVSFRDATNGTETYGGGRYLLDTAKGADLGHTADHVVFDFNYAYQPSCSYSPRWSCPLPPADATIGIAVRAGEKIEA